MAHLELTAASTERLAIRLLRVALALPLYEKTYLQMELRFREIESRESQALLRDVVIQKRAGHQYRLRIQDHLSDRTNNGDRIQSESILTMTKTTHYNQHEQSYFEVQNDIGAAFNDIASEFTTHSRVWETPHQTIYLEKFAGMEPTQYQMLVADFDRAQNEKELQETFDHVTSKLQLHHKSMSEQFCTCDTDKMRELVAQLPLADRQELAQSPGYAEISCGFCSRIINVELNEDGDVI